MLSSAWPSQSFRGAPTPVESILKFSGARVNPTSIREVDALVRRNFTYRADPEADTWRSFAGEVRAGRKWEGDCDDLASTVLHMLADAGVEHDLLWRAMVSSTRSSVIDHMIGICQDDDGRLWIVGDTAGPAYPFYQHHYRIIQVSNVGGGVHWRKPYF